MYQKYSVFNTIKSLVTNILSTNQRKILKPIVFKNSPTSCSPENQKSKHNWLLFYCFFCLAACQADPSPRKQSYVKKQIINKSVKNIYNTSVDILFIIDDSISMKDMQNLLVKNADLFINQFLNTESIDYHIGVTTSSITHPAFNSVAPDGKLNRCNKLAKEKKYNFPSYVDRKTPDASLCLKEMMKVGVKGSNFEQFLNIPLLTISRSLIDSTLDFYRPDAHLAIFVITDANDQSEMTPLQAYQALLDLKEGNEKKLHYAAGITTFLMPDQGCIDDDSGFPFKIIETTKFFGPRGYYFNLCQSDYGKSLAHFASHLIESTLTVNLKSLPDLSSIEVYYEHENGIQRIPNGSTGWNYNARKNTIELSRNIHLEKRGGQFEIKYEPLYTPEY